MSDENLVRFGDVADVTDYVANGSFAALKENVTYKESPDHAVLVRLVDFNSGWSGPFVFVDQSSYDFLKKSRLQPGDVVISNVGANAGTPFRVPDLGLPMTLGPNAVVLKNLNVPDFWYYFFSSPAGQHALGTIIAGSAQPKFNKTDLRNLRLPRVDAVKQKEIAAVLNALDDKIELNRRMNETLEEMARALFQDWFVDFGPTRRQIAGETDPATIMGHAFPPEKASTLAQLFPAKLGDNGLPEDWQLRSIYDVAKVIYGAPFKSKQFNTEGLGRPLARIRDLPKNAGGQFTEEVHKNEHLIQPGDIVVGMDGEFRSYLWFGVPTLMNQRICSFVPIEKSNRAFVWLAIKPLLKFFEDTAIATTVIHLGKGDIDTFSVIDAGQDVMTAFSTATEPMASKIVANGQENQTLAEMRDLLLPKLMSGEIRLKDVEDGE